MLNRVRRPIHSSMMLAALAGPLALSGACGGTETKANSTSTADGTSSTFGIGGAATGGGGSGGTAGGTGSKDGAGECSGSSGFDVGPGNLPAIAPTGIFVVNQWHLGDADTKGMLDNCAWMNLGVDLDKLKSDETALDHCQTFGGPIDPTKIMKDGHNGIDNAFGHVLVPYIQQAIPEASKGVSASVQAGWSTLMIRTNLLDLPAGAKTVKARLYVTAPLGSAPFFDGTDFFRIDTDWLLPGSMDPDNAIAQDLQATIDGDRLTISIPDDTAFQLKFKPGEFELSLTAHRVRLILDMDPTHAYVVKGTIAGLFFAEECLVEIKRMLGNANTGFCDWTGFDDGAPGNVIDTLHGAQDILADGTNHAGSQCNAISFGIGFLAASANIGGAQDVDQPPTNPCGP